MEDVTNVPAPIASVHNERPPAPDDVWDWQDYPKWRPVIWKLIDEIVDDEIKRAFLTSPPKYVVGDDLSWLDEIISLVRAVQTDSLQFLSKKLRNHFRCFRAVHGARVTDFRSYYQRGLTPLSPNVFHEQARMTFLSGRFPELTESHLDTAILRVGTNLRENRIWFEGNENMLLKLCGHYMLYGSEYLCAIAAHLEGWRDYRQILKESGRPTVFVCDVPMSLMSDAILEDFAGTALEWIFQELLDGEGFQPEPWQGAGFCIREILPAECIVGHYCPDNIRDPIR